MPEAASAPPLLYVHQSRMKSLQLMARVAVAGVLLAGVINVVQPLGAAAGDRSDAASSVLSTEAGQRLQRDLSRVLSLRATPHSTCVAARVDDEWVFESKSEVPLVPASLMKIVTSVAALEVMAPDEVFTTEVYVRADALASARNGVLRGDVYLVGGGDPVLSTPRYIERFEEPVAHTDITELADRVAAALADRGITRIEGRIVGDDSWFSDRERHYAGHDAGAGVDAEPSTVWKRDFVSLNIVGQLSGLLVNDGFSSYSWGVTAGTRRRHVRAADPAQHAASVFDTFLESRGIPITRRASSGRAPLRAERAAVGSLDSPPLSEILTRVLSLSDNTVAEMLLKEIGRRTAGSARSASAASVQQIMEQKLGPLAQGLVVVDGSGLSNHNRVTCAALVELLSQAGPGSPVAEALSVVARSGTLKRCRPAIGGQDEHNAVRAKTGTLLESTALAGTTTAADGEVLTFAMIANRHYISSLGACNSIRMGVINAAARYTYRELGAPGRVHAGDRAALEALFDATAGHGWFNSHGWKSDLPLHRWHGVTTNTSGRVTDLDLGGAFGNGLTGTVPEALVGLSELVRLDLSGNDLSGSLPAGITNLSRLREVRVSGTSLCLSDPFRSSPTWSKSRFSGLHVTAAQSCGDDTVTRGEATRFLVSQGTAAKEFGSALKARRQPGAQNQ